MATLTALAAGHGFTAGDLDTSGQVAVQAAYQKLYFADGNPYNSDITLSGYHKLDFINTRLVGAASGTFTRGEVVTQATSGATGVYDEFVDRGSGVYWHLVYRTGTTEFDTSNVVTGSDSGATLTPSAVAAPPHWLNWTLRAADPTYDYEGSADSGSSTNLVDATLTGVYPVDNYVTDWTCFITGGTGSGSYAVVTAYTASTGTVTVADWLDADGNPGGTDPDGTSTYALSESGAPTSGGVFPDGGSNILSLCFGRIFMNSLTSPHQWFATRINNPLDLLLVQDDVASPQNSQASDKAGQIGDQIVTMVPYKGNMQVFGCLNSMYVMRADPGRGGFFTSLSDTAGFFSNVSYCWDNKNNLYVLGMDGLYAMSADDLINARPPVNILQDTAPQLVTSLALNRRTDRVAMAYDKDRYGINISVTQMDGAWNVSFWVDLRTNGVFPDRYGDPDHYGTALYYFNARTSEERQILCGCQDGYVRTWDEAAKSDDGTAIDSRALIGPVTGASIRSKLDVNELSIKTSENTDSVTVGVFVKETAEKVGDAAAADETPKVTKTFNRAGLLPSMRKVAHDGAVGIMLSNNSADSSWSIDEINADIKEKGRVK